MAGIAITLGGNFSKLDDLKNRVKSTAGSIKGSFSGVSKALSFTGAGVSIGAAFTAITAATKSAIDAGGELADMMARTGAAGEKLFVMQRAFENAGIAGDKVPGVLNRMQKALAGVNEEGQRVKTRVFEDLGLAVANLQSMDPAEAFRTISENIAKLPDPAERAAAAMEIFGKSGGELLVVMNDGKAFANAAEQVGGLGKTLAAHAEDLDKVSDSMGLIGIKAQQIGAEIAVELLPELTAMSDTINKLDLSAATRDAIDYAKAIGKIGSEALNAAKYLPGVKLAGLVTGAVGAVAGLAGNKFGSEQGTALPSQDPFNEGYLSRYNEGVMIPPPIEEKISKIIPALLQPFTLKAQDSLEKLGIPLLSDLLGPLPFDIGTSEQKAKAPAQFNAGGLGAFAQSMNMLFGRSANAGLIDENKRQTKLLEKLVSQGDKRPVPVQIEVVPTFG